MSAVWSLWRFGRDSAKADARDHSFRWVKESTGRREAGQEARVTTILIESCQLPALGLLILVTSFLPGYQQYYCPHPTAKSDITFQPTGDRWPQESPCCSLQDWQHCHSMWQALEVTVAHKGVCLDSPSGSKDASLGGFLLAKILGITTAREN